MTTTVAAPASVAETLRAARAKIEDSKHWTKGAYARTSKRSDETVAPDSAHAKAWCSSGAVRAVDGRYEGPALILLATVITGQEPYGVEHASDRIVDFNDLEARRHRDVLAAFDRAIAAAEGQSQ